jgi:thiamine biosynthesis lipoprotein
MGKRLRGFGIVIVFAAVGVLIGVAILRHRPSQVAMPDSSQTGGGYATYAAESMGTTIGVVVPAADGADASARVVFDIFRDVDERMSEWKPTSPLSAVNRLAGVEPAAVPGDLRAVVRQGMEIGERTDGAFDITWAALWGVWDFKANEPSVPAASVVAERVGLVDSRRVVIDDEAGTVFLPEPGMKIGLGGIAKGYALGLSSDALRERGIGAFLLTAGGQVYAAGLHEDRPWRVGIQDPRGPAGDFFAMIGAENTSVSTSGDYERFFIIDGVRYHHIIDPRTGMPARGLRSVTIVCSDPTLADALSTAVFVMGKDKGLALVGNWDGVEAVLVDDDARVHVTSGLDDAIEIIHQPIP